MSPATDAEVPAESVFFERPPRREPRSPPFSPRLRGVLTAVVVAVPVLDVLVVAIGWLNPWHLVVVDRWLFHPWLPGLAFLAAGTIVSLLHPPRSSSGSRMIVLVMLAPSALLSSAIGGGRWAISQTGSGPVYEAVANEHNDVTAHYGGFSATVPIILGADRGRASRSQVVESVGYVVGGDSGPPTFDLAFPEANEMTVSHDGQVVYRLTFDPGTLDVVREECRTAEEPIGSFTRVIGCED